MRISDRKAAAWLSQMADSLASGITPAEAVGLVGGLPDAMSNALVNHFESGRSWSEAVDSILSFLTETERSILIASEASGTLSAGLERLAEKRQARIALKNKLFFALLYPTFIVHFAILIVPIQRIVDGEYEAYAMTLATIYLPLWGLGILALGAARVSPNVLRSIMRLVPMVRKYSMNRDMADLSESLAVCGMAGIGPEHSWALAIDAIGSRRFNRLGESVLTQIGQGNPASSAFSKHNWLPSVFAQQYKVGEKTGQLVTNLQKSASSFSKDAKRSLMVATLFYSGVALALAFALAAFQILSFYSGYFDQINEIAS